MVQGIRFKIVLISAIMIAGLAGNATAQSTSIDSEYLMTLHAPLEPPQVANSDFLIYNVKPGGWVKGPNIEGEIIGPSADWLRIMPNGTLKLDVRASIKADDGSIIFTTYTGRVVLTPETNERFQAGEALSADDIYFYTSPTFETTSEKYAWLNNVVAVGKMISARAGEDSYVTDDLFALK